MPITHNGRTADHDIDPIFLTRWSPRAFTGEPMPEEVLRSLFEAARWAPSAFNLQPWRFVYARRDTPDWARLLEVLIPYNQAWVKGASALAFVISDRFRRPEGAEPIPLYSHSFDAGAAWACLALQAHHLGWAAHGMTGLDFAKAYEVLEVPEADWRVEAAIAIGRPADKSVLPEAFQARETPSPRDPIAGKVFEGRFKA
jgi:nitroreductase